MTALVYFVLCLIWGSTWIAIKIGLSDAPPLWAASLRFLLAVTLIGGYIAARGYRLPTSLRQFLRLGYPGVYMYGASYALVYFSELHINSAMAAVLFGSFPFFVALLSHFRLRAERISALGWGGLLVGFLGVVLISYESLQTSQGLFLGSLLALAGSLASAHGLVIHKKKFAQENIYVSAFVQMSSGGVLLLLSALLFENFSDFRLSEESVGSIVYLAILGTVVAFLGYYWLLRKTRAVIVSMIAFVTPLVAILIGVYLFDEHLSALILVGTAMILSGIVLVVRK